MPSASPLLASGVFEPRQYEEVFGLGSKRTEAYKAASNPNFKNVTSAITFGFRSLLTEAIKGL